MIYTEGCLPKASHWFETHILPVAIIIVILAILQVNKKQDAMDFEIVFVLFRSLAFALHKIFVMIFSLKKLNGHGVLIQ
jgi:hypothetical protein